jgi:hypothetical protein
MSTPDHGAAGEVKNVVQSVVDAAEGLVGTTVDLGLEGAHEVLGLLVDAQQRIVDFQKKIIAAATGQ